jgi:hypothetical protein
VVFTATAKPRGPTSIVIASGSSQTGAVGETLPYPFVVSLTDEWLNPLPGWQVSFQVMRGGGTFGGYRPESTWSVTDEEGRAVAYLTLGPEPGSDNNVVHGHFSGNEGPPAIFVASGTRRATP